MWRCAVISCTAAVLAGCGGSGSDRAGGDRGHRAPPVTVTLANANRCPFELQAFADTVRRMSHGRLRIRFANEWRKDELGAEAGIIRDVRAGRVELGWTGARAWPSLGVHAFDSLQVPFLIDSVELESAVLESPLGAPMVEALTPLGLIGIAVLPGPLRRLEGRVPLRSPADLRGRRIASQTGEVEQEANVALEPRPLVVFAGPLAQRRLTRDQLALLQRAGRAAIRPTARSVADLERVGVALVCRSGGRLVTAAPQDLAALRHAVRDVRARLAAEPGVAAAIAAIEDMAAGVAPETPATCPTPANRTTSFPDATYRFRVTQRELRRVAGFEEEKANGHDMLVDTTYDDGHVTQVARFADGTEEVAFQGSYSVYRDRIEIGDAIGRLSLRWSPRDGVLRLRDFEGDDPGDAFVWVRNMRRVGPPGDVP